MSKTKLSDPINLETEVTREDIAKLAGASLAKVHFVTNRKKWGFPEIIRKGCQGKNIYSLAAVTVWLENNDLKAMKFYKEDRAPAKDHKQTEKAINSTAIAQLKTGIKQPQFKVHGKSVRVHVEERNEYEKPRPQLTRFSNSGAGYISHYIGNEL